jgi:hypothetical protein
MIRADPKQVVIETSVMDLAHGDPVGYHRFATGGVAEDVGGV